MGLKKTIAIGALALILLTQAVGAWAQEPAEAPSAETPEAVKSCEKKAPEYPTIADPETGEVSLDSSKIDLSASPYGGQVALNFRIAFEKSRSDYHAYMECIFEKVVEDMLGSSGGKTEGIFGANAPNLPEWSKPESACLPEENLTDLLIGGSPATLLPSLLGAYDSYVNYLQLLFNDYSDNVTAGGGAGAVRFEELFSQNRTMKLLVENEIEDALVALDGTFIGLKEMRQSFLMHVHFQCMLKNLEYYRRAMENLRRVVSSLPSVIQNASIHK